MQVTVQFLRRMSVTMRAAYASLADPASGGRSAAPWHAGFGRIIGE